MAAYFELLKGQDRLPRGAMETLKSRFPHLIRLTHCRASMCGGQEMKLTAALAHAMISVNDENWGRLSIKKLTSELCKSGYDCSQTSVCKW